MTAILNIIYKLGTITNIVISPRLIDGIKIAIYCNNWQLH